MAKKRKHEARQESSYTDLILQARLDAAGATALKPTVTAAVESCAGLWERAFGAAVNDTLSAAVLSQIGRALLLRGEYVAVRLDGELVPAAHWDVHGRGASPQGWRYRLDVQAPDGQLTVHAPGRDVFHPRVGVRPEYPWRGFSPLSNMAESVRLLANIEVSLADEMSGPTGHVLPVPSLAAAGTLKDELRSLKGRTALGETTKSGWGVGEGQAPQADFRPQRIGPEPATVSVQLREQAAAQVLAACGVPVELIRHSEAGGSREAWRRFLHGTIAPVGRLVGAEAQRALGAGAVVNFDALFASDLAGRARAYQSLVGAGMEDGMAKTICGF